MDNKKLKLTDFKIETSVAKSQTIYTITAKYFYPESDWRTGEFTGKETSSNRVFTIVAAPTGNCQLGSLCTVVNLIDCDYESWGELIKMIREKINTRILVLDVNGYNYKIVRKNIKDDNLFLFNTSYTSTNGSHMIMLGLDVRKFVESYYTSEVYLNKLKIDGENKVEEKPQHIVGSAVYKSFTKEEPQEIIEDALSTPTPIKRPKKVEKVDDLPF